MDDATAKQTRPNAGPKQKLVWIIAGTVAAIMIAGVAMQFLRSETGNAAVEEAGTAKVSSSKPIQTLARVNNELIPYDAVAKECVARYGRDVLDDLINRVIIQQECEKRGVTVTEDEVTREIVRIAKKFNLDPAQWCQMLLAERNMTEDHYRKSVIWPMLALKKLAGEQVEITEEELHQAFRRNYGERVKARIIVCRDLRHAQKVWEEARKHPEEFEKLAQEHSIDPNSRSLGGVVPPIPQFSGNTELENAAFKLKPDEISGIIQGLTGHYYILKCEGRTEQIVRDIAEVQDSLVDELKEAKTQRSVAAVFEKIKEEARVDNYLTSTTTGPDRTPAAAAGQIRQASGVVPTTAPPTIQKTRRPATQAAPKQPQLPQASQPGGATRR